MNRLNLVKRYLDWLIVMEWKAMENLIIFPVKQVPNRVSTKKIQANLGKSFVCLYQASTIWMPYINLHLATLVENLSSSVLSFRENCVTMNFDSFQWHLIYRKCINFGCFTWIILYKIDKTRVLLLYCEIILGKTNGEDNKETKFDCGWNLNVGELI